jgi:hypothetical protein
MMTLRSSLGVLGCALGITSVLLAGGRASEATQSPVAPVYGTIEHAHLGLAAGLGGDVPFPVDNPWNTDISDSVRYPVDPNSAAIIAHIGAGTGLHADFGPPPYGIPYIVVDESQQRVPIEIRAEGFRAESDVMPMPIPKDAPVEGYAQSADSDAHVVILERGRNRLYELYHAARATKGNGWLADSTAVFDLSSNNVRPSFRGRCGVTSADAAGLPIFPGLVRYDEVAAGRIGHALRFTVESSRAAAVPPATHWASTINALNRAPMGMRVRLKASYVIPEYFSKETKVILQALKSYGMIVADNGGNWFISGSTDSRWPMESIGSELKRVKGSNFEVIKMDGLIEACH